MTSQSLALPIITETFIAGVRLDTTKKQSTKLQRSGDTYKKREGIFCQHFGVNKVFYKILAQARIGQ
jgi:hypothetical protein